MAASIWFPGYTVSTTGKLLQQDFTTTAAQTVFTITNFTYLVGGGQLKVFVNGTLQRLGTDYIELTSTTFALTEGCVGNETVSAVTLGI